MNDVVIFKGKIYEWYEGDIFVIRDRNHNSFKFDYDKKVSPERMAILDAMRGRKNVEVIIRVVDE